jgi:hypothetical protein
MNDDQRLAANGPRRRDMTRTYRRPGALAVLIAAAAIGLAACSSGSSTPQVASLGTRSSDGSGSSGATGGSTTPGAAGNATQSLGEWTACMRSHGDPNQATPTIDASKVIHVTSPADFSGSMGLSGETGPNSCTVYMNEASQALAAGSGNDSTNHAPKSLTPLVKFAECMRAHGIADFPDPGSNGQTNMPADSNTPTYLNAQRICARQVGLPRLAGGAASDYPGEVRMTGSGTNG